MARELGEKQLSLDTRRGSRRLFDLVYSRSDIPPELLRDQRDAPGTGIGTDTRLTGSRRSGGSTERKHAPVWIKGSWDWVETLLFILESVFLPFPEFCSSKGF